MVFIAVCTIFINKGSKVTDVSDLTLANIEALANNESSDGKRIICYNKLEGRQGSSMEDKTWCDDCKERPASKWEKSSECPR